MKTNTCITYKIALDKLFSDLDRIRQINPVIHNLTNLVVMPITANLLLALGASPIMAHAKEELTDILQISQALVTNIGTPDEKWLSAIKMAQNTALKLKIPIVLDPVGAGASRYRTEAAKKILERGVTLVRGNASEIMALVDPHIKTKGVDTTMHTSNTALVAATTIAKKYHCIVVVSGKSDLIVNETQHVMLNYGTPLFTKVVGMGCSLTSIIASFLTVNPNSFIAAIHAMALFGLVGELAIPLSIGPGSFYTNLLDKLYTVKQTELKSLISQP
ncbi:MAG: hydroxyethylthiazole kinase [Rickettsiella sp.]|nr:hydroxyethylthiazole kinase [Rickettsiella sp.]